MNKELTLEESMKIYYDRDKKKKKISNKVINRRRVNMFKMLERNDGYFSEENIKRKEHQLEQLRRFSEWTLSLRGMIGQDTTLTKTCGLKHENKIHKQRLLTV